jgi:hypothetical protein
MLWVKFRPCFRIVIFNLECGTLPGVTRHAIFFNTPQNHIQAMPLHSNLAAVYYNRMYTMCTCQIRDAHCTEQTPRDYLSSVILVVCRASNKLQCVPLFCNSDTGNPCGYEGTSLISEILNLCCNPAYTD